MWPPHRASGHYTTVPPPWNATGSQAANLSLSPLVVRVNDRIRFSYFFFALLPRHRQYPCHISVLWSTVSILFCRSQRLSRQTLNHFQPRAPRDVQVELCLPIPMSYRDLSRYFSGLSRSTPDSNLRWYCSISDSGTTASSLVVYSIG